MAYYNTRVWRADTTPVRKSRMKIREEMDEAGFEERVSEAVKSKQVSITTSFGKEKATVYVSRHAANQFRNRGCSTHPELLCDDIQELLKEAVIGDQVVNSIRFKDIIVLVKETRTVYALCVNKPSEGEREILLKTYFYMGFNAHKVFFVDDEDSQCVSISKLYGKEKEIICGIENIPEFELNSAFTQNK